MTLEPGPQTVLVGEVRGQAHLYGLLDRLRDFRIELVAVVPASAADASAAGGETLPEPSASSAENTTAAADKLPTGPPAGSAVTTAPS